MSIVSSEQTSPESMQYASSPDQYWKDRLAQTLENKAGTTLAWENGNSIKVTLPKLNIDRRYVSIHDVDTRQTTIITVRAIKPDLKPWVYRALKIDGSPGTIISVKWRGDNEKKWQKRKKIPQMYANNLVNALDATLGRMRDGEQPKPDEFEHVRARLSEVAISRNNAATDLPQTEDRPSGEPV